MLVSIILISLGIIGMIAGIVMMIIGSRTRWDYTETKEVGFVVFLVSILIMIAVIIVSIAAYMEDLEKVRVLEMKMENPTQSLDGIITELEIREVIKMKAHLDTYDMFSNYYFFKDRINTLYANIK